MNQKIIDTFTEKFSSGKFLFTIIAAFVFAYLSVTGKLPMDKVMEVVLIVIYAYFTKKPDKFSKRKKNLAMQLMQTQSSKKIFLKAKKPEILINILPAHLQQKKVNQFKQEMALVPHCGYKKNRRSNELRFFLFKDF